jgi:hypothetical protein
VALVVMAGFVALSRPVLADEDDDDIEELEARWPLEWVLRPQTLRQGMLQLVASGQEDVPNHHDLVDPVDGHSYQFSPALSLGLSFGFGLTDRLEIGLWAPRLLCLGPDQDSACDPTNRYKGLGGGATYGVLRRDRVQVAVSGQVDFARSSPDVLEWSASASLKLIAPPRLAFGLTASARRAINPPVGDPDAATFGSIDLGVDLQATRRLLLFTKLVPWAPIDRLRDGVALEVLGGVSYAVSHQQEIGIQGGSFNVLLSNPPWNAGVPEWFVTAWMTWWADWSG